MEEVRVRAAGLDYTVYVGNRLYEGVLRGELEGLSPRRVVVVSHPSIYELYGRRLSAAVEAVLTGADPLSLFLFPQGEENKVMRTLQEGYSSLLECSVAREDLLIAFGGGVVGDLAGFLAATYMRGIRYMQVPTTLMAMVDSSIGGKVGVDLPGAKNAVGAFYQPLAVISDTGVLGTLPEREVRSGFAEVAKYGFLYDEDLLRSVKEYTGSHAENSEAIEGIVARCAGHKARVVEGDERDLGGVRAMLNYGHTFGHALESAAGFGYLRHGEAVAAGMMMAARLSEVCGLAKEELSRAHREVLMPLLEGLQLPGGIDGEAVLRHMKSDKKRGASMRFVLLERLQEARLVEEIQDDMVKRAAEEVMSEMRRWG